MIVSFDNINREKMIMVQIKLALETSNFLWFKEFEPAPLYLKYP